MQEPTPPANQSAAPAAVETVLTNVTPGAQTSEFRLVLAVLILTALGGVTKYLPAEWAVVASGILAAGWTVARLFYKFQLGQLHVDQVLGMADAGSPLSALLNAAALKKLRETTGVEAPLPLNPPIPSIPSNAPHDRAHESGSSTVGDLAKLTALCLFCLWLATVLVGCGVTLGADFGKGGEFTGGHFGVSGTLPEKGGLAK